MMPSGPKQHRADASSAAALRARGGDAPRMPRVDLVLASKSPRRRQLLTEAGLEHRAVHPGVDDGTLVPSYRSTPEQWSMALAYYKAASAAAALSLQLDRQVRDESGSSDGKGKSQGRSAVPTIVLGADTVVHHRGEIIGQPKDLDDAARIIERLENDDHDVITGVALIDLATGRRDLFADTATVKVGRIGGERIGEYLATGQWHGKAGAYNLSERLEAGWPIEYRGDAGTIMGLPVGKVVERLRMFVV